ncbi:MAG: aspartate aminotransferase family protein [Rhodobacteraceae bacterium]|nr:aspartate aminotransferase family protein [Paracoccaceae bacterium]
MAHDGSNPAIEDYLDRAAHHARAYRAGRQPIGPTASVSSLRERFCLPLSDHGRSGAEVIDALIGAAEVGLVGNTDPNFFAWVMGGSNLVGVAADWLTSAWGQNAAIFQSSPAAAVAEEAVESWLLELLDLPRESSVGFVGGATTAAFVCLAAARAEVLRRAGYDLDRHGLQGAPLVAVFLSEDAHVTNFAALRNLGFGDENFHRMPSDGAGLMRLDDLAEALAHFDGPKIIIAQAGHINSGAFEPLQDIAGLARRHDAWLHIDGAFGLWARASLTRKPLAAGAESADSWSVDGHKWLQIPYGSGFAIVHDRDVHRRAMQKTAGYLNAAEGDGRCPSDYTPDLSRRAHGFAAWAVLRSLGRDGVAALVDRHCDASALLAERIRRIDGLTVLNPVRLNQIVVAARDPADEEPRISRLAERLNARGDIFVRTAFWKGRTILRLSVISQDCGTEQVERLGREIERNWDLISATGSTPLRVSAPCCDAAGDGG